MNFVLTAMILILIGGIWFVVARSIVGEPYLAALLEKYGTREVTETAQKIVYRNSLYGWYEDSKDTARCSWISRLGVDSSSLIVKQPKIVRSVYPNLIIPREHLEFIESKFIWSAFSRLDVFKVNGIEGGKLLLPTALLGCASLN